MKILINERLSKHRCKTPEGYLICTDAILARTGKQTYRKNEIFKDSDDETEIEVDRTEDEVFAPQTLASFENKPVTVEHPDEDVNVHNYKEYAVGFVRDVHRGEVDGQPVILGNLVITDEQTIQEIENGEHTDLSCGYDCDIADEPNPCQRNIRGNHVALCECGRAGIARIVDSKCKDFDDTGKNIRVVKEFIEQNGNKFDKRKDADAILEYIKKRTGIANADYGDVLYIIKEYTRAEITDSVKDVSALEFDNILDLFERKGIDYSDADDEVKYIWFRNNNMYDKAVQELRRQRYSFKEATNKRGTKLLKLDSVKDANHLPAKVKRDLQKFLNHKSTFIRNKDYDISEFVKEFERISRLWVEFPLKIVRESIKGWFKTGDGMMRKDYTFSIEGYDDRFMVSIYAKPDTYETTELNAYFTDSVKDAQHSELGDKVRFRNRVYVIIKVQKGKSDDVARLTLRPLERFDENDKPFEGGGDSYWDIHIERWQLDDSINDALIPPTKEAINKFEVLLRIFDINIDRKGLTPLGRVHYQVRANMEFDQFVKRLNRIDNEMNELGIPMTFNAGSDGKACTAGIDLDKQYVKDSQRAQKIQKIIKVVKSIK